MIKFSQYNYLLEVRQIDNDHEFLKRHHILHYLSIVVRITNEYFSQLLNLKKIKKRIISMGPLPWRRLSKS
jgi:hypothetical protein